MAICSTHYHTHAAKSNSAIHVKEPFVSKEDSKCHDIDYNNGMSSCGTALPVLTDGIPFLPSSDHLRNIQLEGQVRKCPNTEEGGENGNGTSRRTQDQDEPKGCCRTSFVFPSTRGPGRGQGNGDDEDDDEQPTDYKKKWLGCDGKKQKVKMVNKSKMSVLNSFIQDRGATTNFRLDGPRRQDEVDACMAEQAVLLSREKSSQGCPENRVIYSTQHAHIISFVQHLFQRWGHGSFIDPGYSEGVICGQNLTLNPAQQYRFGEEFLPFAELGRGDFGVTRACYDWTSRVRMATKEIPKEKFLPFEVLQLAKVRSPFITRFLGATAERSSLYLHMELIDNAVQLEYVANEGHMLLGSQDMIVQIFFQLLGALDCLQKCKVVHRDLTCRNVLLTATDRVKVIDFNLAVPAPYEQTAMPVGDMAYLAPEILDGERFLTCAIDWWSVGIIIISLLRGSPQFDNCEQLAQIGYHPLQCYHLCHCHPALRDVLGQILQSDWQLRPPPSDLIKHRVFNHSIISRDELEEYPARPATSAVDEPDHPYMVHGDRDPTPCPDKDIDPATVPQDETEPSPAHNRVLPPFSSSGASSPPPLLEEGDNSRDNLKEQLSESHEEQPSVRPKKERKIRSIKKFHLAASFSSRQLSGGDTQCNDDGHGCSAVGESETCLQVRACHQSKKGTQNTELLDLKLEVKENPVEATQCGEDEGRIVETHQVELQGAVGGIPEDTSHVYYNNSSMDTRIRGSMELGEFQGLSCIEQEDLVHNGNVPVENGAVPPASDRVESIVTSFNAREKMCVGYGYPEDWLYTQGQNQQKLEEESRNQSDPVEAAVSSLESSFRGTSREESSLENEIFLQQLSSDTSLEFQDNLYRHLSGDNSPP